MLFSTDFNTIEFKPGKDYTLIANNTSISIYESKEPVKILLQKGSIWDTHGVYIPDIIKCNLYTMYYLGGNWANLSTFIALSRHEYTRVASLWSGDIYSNRYDNILSFLSAEAYKFRDAINNIHIDHKEKALDLVTSIAYHYLNKGILNSIVQVLVEETDSIGRSTLLGKFLYLMTGENKYLCMPTIPYSIIC